MWKNNGLLLLYMMVSVPAMDRVIAGKNPPTLLMQWSGKEIHSFRSHIRDHFVLEWKFTLNIVESTPKS